MSVRRTFGVIFRGRGVRQAIFLVALAVVWEMAARLGHLPELLFPPFTAIIREFFLGFGTGELARRAAYSLYLIGVGLGLAIVTALAATALAMTWKTFAEWLTTLMAILHPLPGIAILPVVILWLGTGPQSIIAVIWFSAFWPLVTNLHTGLRSVPLAQIEAGRNLGLAGLRLVWTVLLPGSLPHILTGLRVAWARAWQASVAAEMVFGAAGGEGGLGWYIYKQRYFMEIAAVFAGMTVIVLIGLLVEELLFELAESRTVRRWGMTLS
ncbi:MAG: ABC transporter permease [Chitinophagales bacterium]